jgi:Arylsulfotransferase (ASST)
VASSLSRILAGLPKSSRGARAGAGGALVVIVVASIATATGGARPSPACAPRKLNVSVALAGGRLTVSPGPAVRDASNETQVSMLGVPAANIVDVSVTGSRSGRHRGRLLAYSQGDGASFVPARYFDQGEQVSVRATLLSAGHRIPVAWSFTVAERDSVSRSLETPPPPPPPPKYDELQHFVSDPNLLAPTVVVTHDSSRTAENILLAPYAGPGQYGPMILDGSGRLLWFDPIPKGERAADLRVQRYEGRPVLTWWQQPYVSGGRRDGALVIADSSYRTIKVVRAGNGYEPDLHAFQVTPRGTALFTVYDAVRCDLSAHHGPADGAVADTLFQEIDLKTGLVRYEWHSLDHVSMEDSYLPIGTTGTPRSPWDWFHINVIAEASGRLLVDARNTWAAYRVDPVTGRVIWRLGGKRSSFTMEPQARPAWQHDLRIEPDGTVSFFDNGATPAVHKQSRVIVLRLDATRMTATLVSSFVHPKPLVAASQGNFQPLPGGNWFVGWGQEPYFSEYSATGVLLFDAHLPATYQSYTAFKYPWVGTPAAAPSLAITRSTRGKELVHASWNGSTDVASWRVLGGADPRALAPLATSPRQGFETTIEVPTTPRYLKVQALGARRQGLRTSRLLRR